MTSDAPVWPVVKRLFGEHAREYIPRYAVAFFFMAIVAGSTALTAWLMRDVINDVFVKQDRQALTWLPLVIAGLFMAKGFAAYIQEVLLSRIGNQIVAHMQKRLYDHMLRMDVKFFQERSSGELITRMSTNAQAAREMMNLLAVGLGRDLLTVISLFVVMALQDPLLSCVLIVVGPGAAYGMRQLSRRVKKVAGSEVNSMIQVVSTMRETTQGIRIIKSFQLEDKMREQMAACIEAVQRLNNKMVAVKARVNPLLEAAAGLAIAAAVAYAGWRTISHGQSPGEFFAFIAALLMAGEPLRRLSRLQLQLVTCAVQIKMLYDVLDTPAVEAETQTKPQLVVRRGEVRFDKTSFAYTDNTPVLNELSFTAPAGKTTALVGLSGSGKTTVFNLLQDLWRPSSGAIYIDNQSIADVSLSSLRRQMALVSQDVFMFEGTVRENLVGALKDVSEDAVIAAARAAHADEFIRRLPQGYDTPVGELGGRLSGGQRQRLSIARAFLKDAPIILLDEPTSALDSETERIIQTALQSLTGGRTTIVIAHRLATVAQADVIHVLDQGRVVESGNQAELLRRDGRYARLHRLQFWDLAAQS
ncbi:MAG: ABC transporter ATP-binding protein [Hyphomicrobium sp.]|nr:ABC transporter ATP-binding protein [Hyphomicrobium sp.]